MYTVFLLLHVVIAGSLIALVLLQQGKGAEAGAAFGSGASATVFGSRGSASFLSRITAGLATGFFLTSLVLAYFATQGREPTSVLETSVINEAPTSVPAADVPTDDANTNTVPADLPNPDADTTTVPATPAAETQASDVDVPQVPAEPSDDSNNNSNNN